MIPDSRDNAPNGGEDREQLKYQTIYLLYSAYINISWFTLSIMLCLHAITTYGTRCCAGTMRPAVVGASCEFVIAPHFKRVECARSHPTDHSVSTLDATITGQSSSTFHLSICLYRPAPFTVFIIYSIFEEQRAHLPKGQSNKKKESVHFCNCVQNISNERGIYRPRRVLCSWAVKQAFKNLPRFVGFFSDRVHRVACFT